MKRSAVFCLLLALMTFLTGCFGSKSANVNLSGGERTALLSGYPIEELPLYKCSKVNFCKFELSEWEEDELFGKDSYLVCYNSGASQTEVLSYYSGLLSQREKAGVDTLTGKIKEDSVSVYVTENKGTSEVYLTLFQEAKSNPYFDDYPDIVKALGENRNRPYFKSFERSLDDKVTECYSTSYVTDLSQQEFLELYQKEYGNKSEFKKYETDTDLCYSFTDGNYACEVYMNKPQMEDDVVTLTIDIAKK